ncbi:MAG: hypothetical protein IPJ00_12065 [Saprospirales bacterium]|nr:hypothetical protein [Saprospirales bacterium]
MHKALLCSLALALAIAHQLAAQCNLPSPPGTGAQGCQNAPLFCSEEDMDGYCSTTGATGAGTCPSAFCGTCQNSHWLSFIAGGTVVTLTISPSNCAGQPSGTGLQAQLFATTDCTNFTAVSNCDGAGQATPLTLTAAGLVIGEVYYLLIDGWAGDECDYEIDVTEGIGNLPPPIIPGIISGPTNVCPGASVNYTVPSGTGVTLYDWSLSPAIGGITNDGSNSITVDFTAQGIAQLCVTPSNACEAGPTICKSIISTPIPPQVEIVNFCLGETWTCQGQTYSAPGTNAVVYDSWMGCDSTRICVGIAAPPNPIPAPVYATICQGEIYQQGESEYDETGQYTDTLTASSNGCDSIQTLILTVLQAEAVIAPPGVLGCGGSSTLVLDGTGSTYIPGAALSYLWSGPGVVSGGNTLTPTVNQTGTYCLTVTHTYQGVTCSDTECVVVQGIYIPPNQPSLTGPLNTCTGATSTFIVSPSGTGLQPTGFTWAVTGGVLSGSGDSIEVTWTETGQGTVCVTADNSCGSSPQACLNVDISDDPIIMPPVEAAICQGESYPFAGTDYDSSGIYTITLSSSTGCDSVMTLELTVLQAEAVIAPPGVLGEGGNTTLVLDGTGSTAIPADSNAVLSYLWTGPGLLSGDSTLNPLIDSSGVYCLEVSHIYQGVSCSDLACVTVTSINDPPEQPALAGPSGACMGTSSEYTVAPSGAGLPATGFSWTVTGGAFSTQR